MRLAVSDRRLIFLAIEEGLAGFGISSPSASVTAVMEVTEFDKEIASGSTIRGERRTSSSRSHTSNKARDVEDVEIAEEEDDDDHSSVSTVSTSAEIQSIHHTWSRNSGHAWPGDDKELAGITTTTTNATSDPRFEVDFDDSGDNPQDWPMAKKALIIFFMSFSTLVVVMYSTSYTSGIPGMMRTFGIESKTLVVLGITTYLCGLAVGSLLLAPLSEMYGRRPVYLIAVAAFTILIVPCALANNLPQILVMRFFGAVAGAAMISNAPGTVSDIVSDDYRALAFSIWSLGPMNGPVVG